MPWLLTLHITALLVWCASLLYIPALVIADHGRKPRLHPPSERGSMARFIFTSIASPAAVIAIVAGTLVFLLHHTVSLWLIVKLSLVSGLVVMHVLTGKLLLSTSDQPQRAVLLRCAILSAVLLGLMGAITLIVLAKPWSEILV